jgi:hemolysin-activating ACP:hemolysin acyltransferase
MRAPNIIKLIVIALTFLFTLLISCESEQKTNSITEADKKAIEKLARDLPMILSNQGWKAYEDKFSKDYTNWSMVSEKVRKREEYLSLVKDWYEKGNRASGSSIKTIDFIPIEENNVMYLYALQEEFTNPHDSTQNIVRNIRFVGNFRKENGSWKNTFTAFIDLPKKDD